ncbi:MAG TPA: hypothetical protein VG406_13150 [Isosphaeraceae bacterium]|jgi:tetratricopeptide (TPR) repeat protein|nr:hypothetical protein [Isosphaeraceae bacterium]
MLGRSWAAPAAAILLLVVGCSKQGAGTQTAAAPGQSPAKVRSGLAPIVDVGGPVTEEDAKTFGADLEKAAREGGPAVNRLINWDALVDRSTGGLGVAEKLRTSFKSGILQSVGKPSSLGAKLAENVANGGSYALLHVHEVDGRRRAMFRMIDPQGVVGYQDYDLARGADGKVRAADIFVVTSGESLAATFRRVFIPLAAHESRGLLERLTGAESDLVKNLSKIEAMTNALNGGQYSRALDAFDQLPPALKKEKAWEILRIQAAQKLGDDAKYAAAIDDFRANHPDDPAADLQSIDSYIIKKQYEKAIEGIDRLDKAVGGDPYLDTMRGNVYLISEKPEEARKAGERAIAEEADLVQGYAVVVAATLRTKEYDATLDALRKMRKQFGRVNIDAFSGMQGYDEFAKSPQFEEFRKEAGSDSKPGGSADSGSKPADTSPAARGKGPGPRRPPRLSRPPMGGRRRPGK